MVPDKPPPNATLIPEATDAPCPTDKSSGWLSEDFWRCADVEEVRSSFGGGANVNARDDDGRTPLHWAAAVNDHPAVIQVLLDNGANVEAKADQGFTPLHTAASENENAAVIHTLLGNGADIEARTNEGKTGRAGAGQRDRHVPPNDARNLRHHS